MELEDELELIKERITYYEGYTELLNEKINKIKLYVGSTKNPDLQKEIELINLRLEVFHANEELKSKKRQHEQYINSRVQIKEAIEQSNSDYTERMISVRLVASDLLSNISLPQENRDRLKAMMNAVPETAQEKHFLWTAMNKELAKCKQFMSK